MGFAAAGQRDSLLGVCGIVAGVCPAAAAVCHGVRASSAVVEVRREVEARHDSGAAGPEARGECRAEGRGTCRVQGTSSRVRSMGERRLFLVALALLPGCLRPRPVDRPRAQWQVGAHELASVRELETPVLVHADCDGGQGRASATRSHCFLAGKGAAGPCTPEKARGSGSSADRGFRGLRVALARSAGPSRHGGPQCADQRG